MYGYTTVHTVLTVKVNSDPEKLQDRCLHIISQHLRALSLKKAQTIWILFIMHIVSQFVVHYRHM